MEKLFIVLLSIFLLALSVFGGIGAQMIADRMSRGGC